MARLPPRLGLDTQGPVPPRQDRLRADARGSEGGSRAGAQSPRGRETQDQTGRTATHADLGNTRR